MKTCFLLGCIFCAVAAAGQVGGSALSAQTQRLAMPENPQEATRHDMNKERDLLEQSGVSYAQGQAPLWEVMGADVSSALSLGDVARDFRKEHSVSRKAVVVWSN